MTDLFVRPPDFSFAAAGAWFSRIAEALLNRSRLVVAGELWRLTELEFYYRGPGHEDPFAHAHPVQANCGRWYFHRTGGSYCGGSFKGLDLTFGDGTARAGILLRGAERPSGIRVDGPSLFVDAILEATRFGRIAELDRALGDRLAWDHGNVVHLASSDPEDRPILGCARVGLSLRAAGPAFTGDAFLTKPYRFLTDPRRTRKGKTSIILGLHRLGRTASEIVLATGSPVRAVATCLAEYEMGVREGAFADFYGTPLGPRDVARLHGIADRDVIRTTPRRPGQSAGR